MTREEVSDDKCLNWLREKIWSAGDRYEWIPEVGSLVLDIGLE